MDARVIASWLRIFVEPGQVTELRAIDVSKDGRFPQTEAGYFDYEHLDDMAAIGAELTSYSSGVYFVPNPIKPALLARCQNRVKRAKSADLTSDNDVETRKWFLVDADPVRPAGISSTDEEKAKAWEVIEEAKKTILHCPDVRRVVLADSGNGYHLLGQLTMPVPDGRVQKMLAKLADKLDTGVVKIDRKVFNPARIVKLYGTQARKGDHTPERPHRTSSVLGIFDEREES